MRIIGCVLMLIYIISLIGIGFICGMTWEYSRQIWRKGK